MKHKLTYLPNRLSVMTVEMPDSQTATVMILVRTGSKYEKKEFSGISHFLEHMCFKGTHTRTGKDIMRYLDGLGAESNAFTGHEVTGYYAKGRYVHWKSFLEVISDIYVSSTFPETEIEKERGVIMGEIDMYADNPIQQVYPDWMALLYPDQPAGRPILGPKENIKRFTRQDLLAYRAQHYGAEKTTLVIAGKVKHAEVVREAKKFLGALHTKSRPAQKAAVKERQQTPALSVRTKKTDQVHIMLGVRSYARTHPDRAVVSLLAAILGSGSSSRLFERLREDMGAGYYVSAGNSTYTDHGYMAVRTGTSPERVAEVMRALKEEMKRLITEPVSEIELNKVKEYVIGNATMALESSDEWADFFSSQYVLGGPIETLAEQIAELKKIQAKDIMRVAKKIFNNKHLNCVIVGPVQKTRALTQLIEL